MATTAGKIVVGLPFWPFYKTLVFLFYPFADIVVFVETFLAFVKPGIFFVYPWASSLRISSECYVHDS